MMFDPANSVRQQLLTRPKAEMCFRPWWDTVEDYVLITMLGLGQKKKEKKKEMKMSATATGVEVVCCVFMWETNSPRLIV